MQNFMVLVHKIVEEGEANIPDSYVQLIFVKSGYTLSGSLPTLKDAGFKTDVSENLESIQEDYSTYSLLKDLGRLEK